MRTPNCRKEIAGTGGTKGRKKGCLRLRCGTFVSLLGLIHKKELLDFRGGRGEIGRKKTPGAHSRQ